MYFVSEGKAYIRDGGVYRNVGFTAKNKVIVTKELESITMVRGDVTVEELPNAVELTEKEVIAKLGLSEENPIEVIKEKPKKATTKKK